ncbi:MAG: TPM domain-containing protein [Candidatus Binatia bacterium]
MAAVLVGEVGSVAEILGVGSAAAEVAVAVAVERQVVGEIVNAQKFFTQEEKDRIQHAVDAAEQHTSGEIVPMIVGASARYTEVELGGLIVGLLLGTIGGLLWADPWAMVQMQLAWPLLGAGFGFILCRIPAIKRRLIPKSRIAEAVHSRSLAAFTAHDLHDTRAHTGILILASLLEHRVEVLADRGINEKVQSGTWDEVVKLLTSGLKSGDGCAAFCRVIECCGEILATYFPRPADDRDELANKLVTEE